MFFKKGVLKNFSNFTGNNAIFNSVIGLKACNFVNKRSSTGIFL